MSGGNSSSLSNGGPRPTTDGSTGGGEVPEEDQEEVLGDDEEDGVVANEGGPIVRSDGVMTPLSKQESRSIKPDDGEHKISKKEHNQDTSSEIR